MTQLRLERSELTYEGTFTQFAFSLLDAPGTFCESLLKRLQPLGATIDDLTFEGGEPGEKCVSCAVEAADLNASAILWADRLEVYFPEFNETKEDVASKFVNDVWDALLEVREGASPRIHSLRYEIDSTIVAETYQSLLSGLAPVPSVLPRQTGTAVGYYLPAEASLGYGESSLALNRSSRVDHGLLVRATLVFEGEAVRGGASIEAARERLSALLRSLQIEWVED